MRNKLFGLASVVLLLSFFYSCKDDDSNMPPSVSVNDFVWKAMNLWYYWQADVPDLADDRFGNEQDYLNFIQSKQTPDLFYGLLFNYGTTDRFSWIVSDFHELQNQFANLKTSFGMKYGLVYESQGSDQIFGYVQYVLPDSPASAAGLKRGDVFTRINGTQLNISNYADLLASETATFGMGFVQDNQVFDTEQTYTLTRVQIRENPVYMTSVINQNGHKIGYLCYNSFASNFNIELNDAFAYLKSQQITDLIIDLRYNGGGAVQTSAYLGSMVNGQFVGQDFTKLKFNSKRSQFDSVYKFEDHGKSYDDDLNQNGTFTLSHLDMNNIYVLTLSGTASASEMLIHSMKPYITVKTIGGKTMGKTVGSITLYDSPSTQFMSSDEGLNPSHTWAMQPIVFESHNIQNQSSPALGFVPDIEVSEIQYLENLPALGSLDEPLLSAAISDIAGGGKPALKIKLFDQGLMFKSSPELERFGTEMYLGKDFDINR